MTKYRKKPVVIEAVQVTSVDFNPALFGTEHNPWDGSPFSEIPLWLSVAIEERIVSPHSLAGIERTVSRLEARGMVPPRATP